MNKELVLLLVAILAVIGFSMLPTTRSDPVIEWEKQVSKIEGKKDEISEKDIWEIAKDYNAGAEIKVIGDFPIQGEKQIIFGVIGGDIDEEGNIGPSETVTEYIDIDDRLDLVKAGKQDMYLPRMIFRYIKILKKSDTKKYKEEQVNKAKQELKDHVERKYKNIDDQQTVYNRLEKIIDLYIKHLEEGEIHDR